MVNLQKKSVKDEQKTNAKYILNKNIIAFSFLNEDMVYLNSKDFVINFSELQNKTCKTFYL
jgi:hypothetical protein